MTNTQQNTHRELPSLTPARPAGQRPAAMLALVAGAKTMDLARLTNAISADRKLCRRLTQAACKEFGCPRLSLEQAIVLLGRDRLASHLLSPQPRPLPRMPVASAWGQSYPFLGEAE